MVVLTREGPGLGRSSSGGGGGYRQRWPGHPQLEGRGSHLAFLVQSGASAPLPCHCLLPNHKSSLSWCPPTLLPPKPHRCPVSSALAPAPPGLSMMFNHSTAGSGPGRLSQCDLATPRARPCCPPHLTVRCIRLVAPAMQMPPWPDYRDGFCLLRGMGPTCPAAMGRTGQLSPLRISWVSTACADRAKLRLQVGAPSLGGGGWQRLLGPGLQEVGDVRVQGQGTVPGKGAPRSALPIPLGHDDQQHSPATTRPLSSADRGRATPLLDAGHWACGCRDS